MLRGKVVCLFCLFRESFSLSTMKSVEIRDEK